MFAQLAYSSQNGKSLVLLHDNHLVSFDVHETHKDALQKEPSRLAERTGRFGSEHDWAYSHYCPEI